MGKKSKFRKDVSLGHGRRISVYAETQKKLDLKVAEILTDNRAGAFVPAQSATVEQMSGQWLAFHASESGIAESTELSYRTILTKHIEPLLGKLRVQQLTEHLISQKLARRSHLSSSTRRKIFLTLRLVLKHAKRRGVIVRDPMEFLRPPTQRNETDREITCMDLEQVGRFLEACEGRRLRNLFVLALSTGARSGELLAIRVSDFVEDFGAMRIRRTLSDSTTGPAKIKNAPKTHASRRNVPLPEIARDAVLDELARRLKDGRRSHDLLFSTSRGTFHKRQNVISRHFRPVLRAAGLDASMTLHDLRHTYATQALNAGAPVHLVSKMLGHASVKITIDLYSHALPDATADVARLVNSILTPKTEAPKIAGG